MMLATEQQPDRFTKHYALSDCVYFLWEHTPMDFRKKPQWDFPFEAQTHTDLSKTELQGKQHNHTQNNLKNNEPSLQT